MKLIGRTLAILAATLVIVGVLLTIGSLNASMSLGSDMAGHGMQRGFNLAGIVQILPTLAIVGIITAVVAPIKQRLTSKRRPNTPARRPQVTTAAPSL
jgi:uncharacterized BrkB/YihY/UPF0761 family membrane protein